MTRATNLNQTRQGDAACHNLALPTGGGVEVFIATPDWQAVLIGDWQESIAEAIQQCLVCHAETSKPNIVGAPSLTIVLCDNTRMRALNAQFAGKPHATNVLAFPSHAGQPYLGDIALGYEAVVAGALASGTPIFHHTLHLIVHAALHLLGYDHASEAAAADMECLESAIMLRLNLPDPYADYTGDSERRSNYG